MLSEEAGRHRTISAHGLIGTVDYVQSITYQSKDDMFDVSEHSSSLHCQLAEKRSSVTNSTCSFVALAFHADQEPRQAKDDGAKPASCEANIVTAGLV